MIVSIFSQQLRLYMYVPKKSTRIVSMCSQAGVYLCFWCVFTLLLPSQLEREWWLESSTMTQSLNSVARMAETLC